MIAALPAVLWWVLCKAWWVLTVVKAVGGWCWALSQLAAVAAAFRGRRAEGAG